MGSMYRKRVNNTLQKLIETIPCNIKPNHYLVKLLSLDCPWRVDTFNENNMVSRMFYYIHRIVSIMMSVIVLCITQEI